MALVPFPSTDVDLFLNLLQTGHGIAIYKASPLQAGDGLFNWFPFLSRFGPTLASAARSFLPALGNAAKEVASDAAKGAAIAAVHSGSDLIRTGISNSSSIQNIPG